MGIKARLDNSICKYCREWYKFRGNRSLIFFRRLHLLYKGRPISVKKDKMRHGYGLKNVERILNKYGGTIAYLSRDKAFQIELLFL